MSYTKNSQQKQKFSCTGAIVPMRMQPMHMGHVNLLLNVSNYFDLVYVSVCRDAIDQDNPYSIEQRFKWLDLMIKAYDIHNLTYDSKGNSEGKTLEDISNNYLSRLKDVNKLYIISGNPDVLDRTKLLGLEYINTSDFMQNMTGRPILKRFLLGHNGHGTVIRDIISKTGIVPDGFLPYFIDKEEVLIR